MEVSEKIKKLRRKKRLSQQEVADKLRMSKNGYGNMERGETGLDNQLKKLQKLAEIFGVDISTFFDSTDQTIFNLLLGETHHQSNCVNVNSPSALEVTQLKQEFEKSCLLLEQQTKEIELLKQQNTDLREMVDLLKKQLDQQN